MDIIIHILDTMTCKLLLQYLMLVSQRKLVDVPRTVLTGLRSQPARPHLQVHASGQPQRYLEL